MEETHQWCSSGLSLDKQKKSKNQLKTNCKKPTILSTTMVKPYGFVKAHTQLPPNSAVLGNEGPRARISCCTTSLNTSSPGIFDTKVSEISATTWYSHPLRTGEPLATSCAPRDVTLTQDPMGNGIRPLRVQSLLMERKPWSLKGPVPKHGGEMSPAALLRANGTQMTLLPKSNLPTNFAVASGLHQRHKTSTHLKR